MQVLKADEVKSDFFALKKKWQEMLGKYYMDSKTLNPEFTLTIHCPHCHSENIDYSFDLNGFFHNACAECNTIYVSPRLNDICIKKLYSDNYYNEMYIRSMLPVFEKRKKLIGQRKFHQTVSMSNLGR